MKNLLSDNEYQLTDNDLSNSYDGILSDSKKMYFMEISKYPLLSSDEEKRYGQMLANSEEKKLLTLIDKGGYSISKLNIDLLFCSLCDKDNYQEIINSLIVFYSRLNSNDDSTVEILSKYLNLANKLNRALNLQEIKDIFNTKDVSVILNEKELFYELKEYMSYKFAFDKMFLSNLRLVANIALKYCNNSNLMDLINEGNIGLMKAVQRYNVNMDKKFSTYASYWIKMHVLRESIRNYSSIRLPEHYFYAMSALKRKIDELQSNGEDTSVESLSCMMDIPRDEIIEYYMYMNAEIRLDDNINDESNHERLSFIASDYDLEDEVSRSSLKTEINKLFCVLKEQEVVVLKLFFGIDSLDGKEYRTPVIAKMLKVSNQRVNQIIQSALFKMKRAAKRDKEIEAIKQYLR